ncbi:MAG TPA: RNA pyrophosphohydrolase [Stellaceae bacterium]|jgi:putative (di)nucleoside polyphosphate hydrolase|nr:RNA pyrophosphohydrolase [Stellaceae bacterium]
MRQAIDRTRYRQCVGIMLVNRLGHVLVARRADMPATPAWQMPQGGIDWGETPREAALRELEEEIGTRKAEIVAESRGWLAYDFPAEVAGRIWGGRFRGQRQKWFLMRFTGCDADIDLGSRHAEFDAFRWVDAEEVPRLIVAFKRRLYIAVVSEFREHCRALCAGE